MRNLKGALPEKWLVLRYTYFLFVIHWLLHDCLQREHTQRLLWRSSKIKLWEKVERRHFYNVLWQDSITEMTSQNWTGIPFVSWFLKKPLSSFFHLKTRQNEMLFADLSLAVEMSAEDSPRARSGETTQEICPCIQSQTERWCWMCGQWKMWGPRSLSVLPMERAKATTYGDLELGIWCGELAWFWSWIFVLTVEL